MNAIYTDSQGEVEHHSFTGGWDRWKSMLRCHNQADLLLSCSFFVDSFIICFIASPFSGKCLSRSSFPLPRGTWIYHWWAFHGWRAQNYRKSLGICICFRCSCEPTKHCWLCSDSENIRNPWELIYFRNHNCEPTKGSWFSSEIDWDRSDEPTNHC